jgi:chromosome segregation ATPase
VPQLPAPLSKRDQITLLARNPDFMRRSLAALVVLSIHVLAFPSISSAQDDGLTFEQAQTRTAFAREQMQAARRELEQAEDREEAALRELADLNARLEQARIDADRATKERQSAEKKHQQAKAKWSQESERLKRIHQRSIKNSEIR